MSAKDDSARTVRAETMSARPGTASASLPKLVSLATDLAKAGPPVDYAKIAQIRQAIAQGEYRVDVDAIANAMFGHFKGTD